MQDGDNLIVHSPKYSNWRITKKTAYLKSNCKVQPESSLTVESSVRVCGSSARFKATNRQFN